VRGLWGLNGALPNQRLKLSAPAAATEDVSAACEY
jgi:hypothetical protein